jgi:uncharacterized membrane protein YbaN (DUF454 family)
VSEAPVPGPAPRFACTGVRWALRGLGFAALAVGIVGLFVPLLPTTVFLLIALWAFSRSSPRFHRWLYEHPRLGPPLRAWHQHRVISPRAKLMALALMAASLTTVAIMFASREWIVAVVALVLLPVAAFILAQPTRAPETTRADV